MQVLHASDVVVSFRTIDNKFLSARKDGSVSQAEHCKGWEQFRLIQSSAGCMLQSAHGTYLSFNLSALEVVQSAFGAQFNLVPGETTPIDGRLSLRVTVPLADLFFVSACPDGKVTLQPHQRSWEMFDVLYVASYPGKGTAFQPVCSSCKEPGNCSCYRGCVSGNGIVQMANGSFKNARDIKIGDEVASSDGGAVRIIARTSAIHSDFLHPLVLFRGLLLTRKHPLFLDNEWKRPEELPGALFVSSYSDLYNFVTEPRKAFFIDNCVVSSLGLHCPPLDSGVSSTDTSSFYGSERVIEHLMTNPQWPDIKFP